MVCIPPISSVCRNGKIKVHGFLLLLICFVSVAYYPLSAQQPPLWRGYVAGLQNYVEPDENICDFVSQGILRIPPKLASRSYYWTGFQMQDTFCVKNNFAFEIKLRNAQKDGGIDAYDISISIPGSNSTLTATLMGAAWAQSYSSMTIGKTVKSNLPELVMDFSDWVTIRIELKDKLLRYSYNGANFFTMNYTDEMCYIKGFNLSFKGSGAVDWIKLYDENGTQIYFEDFLDCNNLVRGCTDKYAGRLTPQIIQENGELISTNAETYQWYLGGNVIGGATQQRYTPTESGEYSVATTDKCFSQSMRSNVVIFQTPKTAAKEPELRDAPIQQETAKPQQEMVAPENLQCTTWTGSLYQSGGDRENHRLTLTLEQDGNTVRGTSRIEYPDSPEENYAIMQVRGTMQGSVLEIEETGIQKENLANGKYWLLKKGKFTFQRSQNKNEADSLIGILVGNRADENDNADTKLVVSLGSTCFVPPPKPKPLPPVVREPPPVVQKPPRPAPPTVPAPPRTTTLRVQVQDDLFDPLNAFVVFRDADTGEQFDERFSNDGVCIVSVPIGKRVSVTAEKPGYEADRVGGMPASETVVITADSNRASLFLRRLGRWANDAGKQGVALSFPPLLFYVDSDILLPESQAEMQRLARQLRETLQQTPTTKFAIEGHTSDEGSAEHNLRLSVNRALAIVKILESAGIPASQLRWEGFGRVFPIADNGSEEGRQRNRRVEIRMKH